MALIRSVKRHQNSGMWAYVEYSNEDKSILTIMGGREFPTQQEAIDYSMGFSIDSYEYIEPIELKRKRLISEKEKLEARLREIYSELNTHKK